MHYSKTLIPTMRNAPAEAVLPSHALMLRAGMIRKISAGFYSYLPLGVRVLQKIEALVRSEMNKSGALECSFPNLLPRPLWQKAGRWEAFKKELFRMLDRHGVNYALAPTHEEAFAELVAHEVNSYRSLPLNLYQITPKYRDEVRPRFGVMRAREFVMKDAYSFHASEKCLNKTYQNMQEVYTKIFETLELDFLHVKADSGAMGGSSSEEFIVKSNVGEETILACKSCSYVANVETAKEKVVVPEKPDAPSVLEKIATPNMRTIEAVSRYLKLEAHYLIKSFVCLLSKADSKRLVLILVRGDYKVNEKKLANAFPDEEVSMASDNDIKKAFGCPPGYLGPLGLGIKIPIVADESIRGLTHAVIGANEVGHHYKGVNVKRDLNIDEYVSIYQVKDGGQCLKCKGKLERFKGIEVGHIFKLGSKYTEALGTKVLSPAGKQTILQMGCYGIGVTRTMAAIIEQYHDSEGIAWPQVVAPYTIHLITLGVKDKEVMRASEEVYSDLTNRGADVLWDERDESAGIKFKDADLIGNPIQVVVTARGLAAKTIEIKVRQQQKRFEVPREKLIVELNRLLQRPLPV